MTNSSFSGSSISLGILSSMATFLRRLALDLSTKPSSQNPPHVRGGQFCAEPPRRARRQMVGIGIKLTKTQRGIFLLFFQCQTQMLCLTSSTWL
ncbi:hypothetical protein BDW62DRAFT_68908 [Aspergillus aurantiobrunneus]